VHRVRGFATGLAGLGVASGDRVATVLRNDPAFLEITMAAGLPGTLTVPVNWHWHGAELGHVLTGSRVVFEDLAGGVREALPPGVPLVEVPVPPELYEAFGLAARGASGIDDCVTYTPQARPTTPSYPTDTAPDSPDSR
jgi:long-chain acyl-CoA synthetase